MTECSIDSCESNLNSILNSQVTFFDVPRCEDDRFLKWIQALGKPTEYFKQQNRFVCSRHFQPEDFHQDIKKNGLTLLEYAVPSLYLLEDGKISIEKLPECVDKTESSSNNINTKIIETQNIKKEVEEVLLETPTREDNTCSKESELTIQSPNESTQDFVQPPEEVFLKKFKCGMCQEIFGWLTELKKHKRIKHEIHKCNICFKHLENVGSLKAHKKRMHNISYVFNCELCDQGFFRNTELWRHMKTHKKVINRCAECKQKFETDEDVKNHDCIVAKKLFECDICKKCFRGKPNLNLHKTKTHLLKKSKEQVKTYECKRCDKTFKKPYELERHKRNHDKPYHCEQCKKSFPERARLKAHELNHSAVECINLGKLKY